MMVIVRVCERVMYVVRIEGGEGGASVGKRQVGRGGSVYVRARARTCVCVCVTHACVLGGGVCAGLRARVGEGWEWV